MTKFGTNKRSTANVVREPRGLKHILAGMLALNLIAAASAQNVPPTVAMTLPLPEASFIAPTSINLAANASDDDGTITSVSFYKGTTLLRTVTTPPYVYNWANVPAGTYIVTSKAKDNAGAVTISAPLTVTVKPNELPSVSLTSPLADADFIGPATVPLAANASDSDGTVKKVSYYRDGTLIGSATVAPYAYNWTKVASGTYSVTAKATDDKGGVSTSAPMLVVVKPNVPPTVGITSPTNGAIISMPGKLTLMAEAADRDGVVSKVQFFNGATLIGSDSSAPFSYIWTIPSPGSYTLTAKATDSKGSITTSVPVLVTVQAVGAPVPVVSITSPQPNARLIVPATFAVTASATVTGDTIRMVEFLSLGTLIGTATAPPYTIVLENVGVGNYNVSAKATGKLGGTATSAVINLSVAENMAPQIVLTANASSTNAPASIMLKALADDGDGVVTKVEFFNNDTLLVTLTQPPYEYTWNGASAGTYMFTARATDDRNASATSSVAKVVLTGAGIPDETEVFYIHTNQINTALEIVSEAGVTVWESGLDAFGANLPNENPLGRGIFNFNLRFPGQYYDKESGLHYNYYRDYDPQTGRYAQSDPIGLAGGINTYVYVGSNLLSYSDPMGLAPKRFGKSHPHCKGIRGKMTGLQNELDTRWGELVGGLPERIGPGERLSETMRGHRKLINKADNNLRYWEKKYAEECDDDDPEDGNSNSCEVCPSGSTVAKTVAGVGAAYAAYRCMRMLPSLAPPLWWTIPANMTVP